MKIPGLPGESFPLGISDLKIIADFLNYIF
jgi:hypothetical protein